MAGQCWRSPRYLSLRLPVSHLPCASFSASAFRHASPPKPRAAVQRLPPRSSKSSSSRDRRRATVKAKPPEPGERKAARRRVVLSNLNALEVPGTIELDQQMLDEAEHQGQIRCISPSVVDRLKAAGAFKATQGWKYFKKPCILMRKETDDLIKKVNEVEASRTKDITWRALVVGERGSGKSHHLLQAMALAMLRNWIVIHIPEAMELTDGHTEYEPCQGTSPPLYVQKKYTADLLIRISAANPGLKDIPVSLQHDLPFPLQSNISLARLCSIGADPSLAHPVFLALMDELFVSGRPPLILSLDGLSHAMRPSKYRSASFELIHAHSLYLISWFMNHLRGRASLPNGGIVLAATSGSNSPSSPSLGLGIHELEALQPVSQEDTSCEQNRELPFEKAVGQVSGRLNARNPFIRYDEHVLEALCRSRANSAGLQDSPATKNFNVSSNIDIVRLRGLPVAHAHSLMGYWAQSGTLRSQVDAGVSTGFWMTSGGGLVGELERACVRMRL